MDKRRDDQCIERRGFTDKSTYYSVREYEQDTAHGWRLARPRAQSFWGLIWTRDAPRPEDLTQEWTKTTEGSFRICDPDLYDQQMREFVGLGLGPGGGAQVSADVEAS